MLVVGDVAHDPLAVAGVGPQPLGLAALVVADDAVGRGEDGLGRAVVLLEQDRRGVREVLLEVEDVADVGAAEGVDRLVGVTHDHQLGRRHPLALGPGGLLLQRVGAQLVDQRVLRVVGVLVLVDQHVPEASAVGLLDLREGLEEVDRGHDQVVEVEGVGLAQAPLVERVRRRVGLLELVARLGGGQLGVAQLVLVVAHPVQQRAGLVALGVQVEVLDDQGHQPLLVLGVVDGEVGLPGAALALEGADLLTQDAHAGGVERGDPHDPGAATHQLLDALLHLGRGLVGEGDGQDRAGVRLALGDRPGDATGEHPGLARARAGDDEQRGTGVHHRGPLGLVEAVEQGVGRRAARGRARGLEQRLGKLTHAVPSLRPAGDSTGAGQLLAALRRRNSRCRSYWSSTSSISWARV